MASGEQVPVRDRQSSAVSHHDTEPRKEADDQKTPQPPVPLTAFELVLAGSLAGGLAKLIVAPLDRVKILYQVSPDRTFTAAKAAKTMATIVRYNGLKGLWRGNVPAMARVMPYAGIQFASFTLYQRLFEYVHLDPSTPNLRFVAGAMAGVTSTLLTYPLDLVRARMAATWGPRAAAAYQGGMFASLEKVIQAEGRMALFKGIRPTLVGIIPYAGLSFATFETAKPWLRQKLDLPPDKNLPLAWRLCCGALAGVVAQTATYPLHVVRRRMQVEVTKGDPGDQSILRNLHKIAKNEGIVRGLFKGLSLNWIKGPVSVGIAFAANDYCKNLIRTAFYVENKDEDFLAVPTKVTPVKTIPSLISGGIAGAVAKTVIAPGDRVKILYQTNPDRPFTLSAAWNTGKKIMQKHGVTGLWRGNGATILRVVPYAATSYSTYPRYELLLSKFSAACGQDPQVNITLIRFMSGAGAGATATAVTYPLDMLRARMAAHWASEPRYKSYTAALIEIIRTEGMRGLYGGLGATLAGVVPYAGFSFMFFETSKAAYRHRIGKKSDHVVPVYVSVPLGGISGLMAQSLTYPLDIVRRRMQIDCRSYRSIFDALITIYENEGIKGGLYKGLCMNWIKGPIAIGISFTVNDQLRAFFRRHSADDHHSHKH